MMTWSFLGLDFLKTRSLTDFMISYDLVRTFESLYVRGVHFDNVPSCLMTITLYLNERLCSSLWLYPMQLLSNSSGVITVTNTYDIVRLDMTRCSV